MQRTHAAHAFRRVAARTGGLTDCKAVLRLKRAAVHVSQAEILQLCQRLEKGARGRDLSLLRRLSVAVAPLRGQRLVETLRATRAGKVVAAVAASAPDSEQALFAQRLVDCWRGAVMKWPLRRLEVQLAGFKTRNAALEGEVAGLRAEAQAVQRDQEEEITRLRQELQSKDAQLQQQEKEFKKLQDQNKTLQGFMRVPGGSMSLPAPTTLPQPSPRMTPRNTPQIFSPALCSQPRVLRSTEPVLSLQTAGPPMSLATFPVRLGQPRQVWSHAPSHPW
ncbi:unnamed protein product [Effrenium voratum]|nr:unnamed protein product [Effrenium voratum]